MNPTSEPRKPFFSDDVDDILVIDDSAETDPAVVAAIQADIQRRRGRTPPIKTETEDRA